MATDTAETYAVKRIYVSIVSAKEGVSGCRAYTCCDEHSIIPAEAVEDALAGVDSKYSEAYAEDRLNPKHSIHSWAKSTVGTHDARDEDRIRRA